ncbi:MAG TPA: signal peptidase II [Opitutaceae bacterium]|nr:signal peptidase II [Opitutaceae bacterium]
MSRSLDPGVSLAWRLLKYRWLISISCAVLAVDQGTKAWIRARLPFNTYGEAAGAIPVVRGFFYIVHVGNTGAAWSMLSGRSILLAALAAATLVAIFLGRRALGLAAIYAQVCFGLLCGGIAGNLADRIMRGHVIDFLDFHFGSYAYPTFNLADTAICIGVALYILSSLRTPRLVAS